MYFLMTHTLQIMFDIDFILIALRIATYGDSIDLNTECPKCQTKNEHTASLNVLLQGFNGYQTTFNFELNDFKFNLKLYLNFSLQKSKI